MKQEKMIEELAKDLQGKDYAVVIVQGKTTDISNQTKKYLKRLIDKGYRKIPEGSVVLTREEYDRLNRVETEKDRLYEIKLDLENQLIEKGWTDYEGAEEIEKRVRKQTAREVLDKVDYESNGQTKQITDLLRKQYGVGMEE